MRHAKRQSHLSMGSVLFVPALHGFVEIRSDKDSKSMQCPGSASIPFIRFSKAVDSRDGYCASDVHLAFTSPVVMSPEALTQEAAQFIHYSEAGSSFLANHLQS